MYGIAFKNTEHEENFYLFLKQYDVSPDDLERVSLFYLLTLSPDCVRHISDIYNREERHIEIDALRHSWVTSSSSRLIRLGFNLFNGSVPTSLIQNEEDYNNLYDNHGEFAHDWSEVHSSLPVNIFCDSEYGPYFIDALRLRFPYLQEN